MTKKEYLNSIQHDLDFYLAEIQRVKAKGENYFYHHGEVITIYRAAREIESYKTELAKVASDKNYKPWKDIKF